MKISHYLYLLPIVAVLLSGCSPHPATLQPTAAELKTPVSASPTPGFTTTPTRAKTIPPTLAPSPVKATLAPGQGVVRLKILLQDSTDCAAPCLWGIVPAKTTLDEASAILAGLGLQVEEKLSSGNKKFYGVVNRLDNGLSVYPLLTVQNDVVQNIKLELAPEKQKSGVPRSWSAYSPETLVSRYGTPSKVEVTINPDENNFYEINMYFNKLDLITSYDSFALHSNLKICPLTDQISDVRIWFGKSPEVAPQPGVPLEKAASTTLDEFTKLLAGNPKEACLTITQTQ